MEGAAVSDERVGPGVHTLKHAIRLLRWWANDEGDAPAILKMIQQSKECADELEQFAQRLEGKRLTIRSVQGPSAAWKRATGRS
jgi:hypothetical protein